MFTITFGEAYQLPTIANQADYLFIGWKYNGTKIPTEGTWAIDVDGKEITLEAYWETAWSGKF